MAYGNGPYSRHNRKGGTEMSADEQGYNSYTNYETWAVSLWLDNTPSSYFAWHNRAEQLRDEAEDMDQVLDGIWTVENAVLFTLADEIEADVKSTMPMDAPRGIYTDLVGHSLGAVNWQEVAGSFLEA